MSEYPTAVEEPTVETGENDSGGSDTPVCRERTVPAGRVWGVRP